MKGVRFQDLYDFEKRADNEEKAYNKGFFHTCVVCGKGIKDDAKVKWLRLLDGGEIITDDDEVQDGIEGDIGCFPCGNDCYRKYKQNEVEL